MEPTLTRGSIWSEQKFTSRASHGGRSVTLFSPFGNVPLRSYCERLQRHVFLDRYKRHFRLIGITVATDSLVANFLARWLKLGRFLPMKAAEQRARYRRA
jgi:hypothetical protein